MFVLNLFSEFFFFPEVFFVPFLTYLIMIIEQRLLSLLNNIAFNADAC